MSTAVIGATGRVGSEIVRGVLARGDAVTALVRDPGKARRAFGEPGGLHIRPTRLDDPRDLTEALDGIRTVFIAMGSTGIEGVLQPADRKQRICGHREWPRSRRLRRCPADWTGATHIPVQRQDPPAGLASWARSP